MAGLKHVPQSIRGGVIYQIFPDRFFNGNTKNDPPGTKPWKYEELKHPDGVFVFYGGDLEGIILKLDYLLELGIDGIYLNPIFESPSTHGYDIVDYYRVAKKFGGDEAFEKLVGELHKHGIKIILDGVFNHSSELHPFFIDVRANGPESPFFNWYVVRKWPFPQNLEKGKALEYYDCWWGIPSLPEWNIYNPETREYLLKVAEFWTKRNIDGWRLDVPNELPHDFWVEFRERTKRINPELYIFGEIWGLAEPWLRGDQFDGVMNYVLRDNIIQLLNQEKTKREFEEEVSKIYSLYPKETHLFLFNLLGSHDTERIFTIFHGNRQKLFLAIVYQFFMPGISSIYYGDEIGMEGGKDPDSRRAFNWDKEQWDLEIFNFYKKVIKMKKENLPLRYGDFKFTGSTNFVIFERSLEGERLYIITNPNPFSLTDTIYLEGNFEVLMKSFDFPDFLSIKRYKELILPPFAFLIIRETH